MKILIIILILIVNIYGNEENNHSNQTKYSIRFIKDLSKEVDSYKSMLFHSILLKDFSIGNQLNINKEVIIENFDDNNISDYGETDYFVKYRFNRELNILDIKLIDNTSNIIIFIKKYSSVISDKYPLLIHKAVSDIFKVLKLIDISWITKYIIFSKFISSSNTQIWISDYSFKYKKLIVEKGINIFPKWSSSKQNYFYFTSYGLLMPKIYRFNMKTEDLTEIAKSDGMIICSDISENSKKILITMSPEGQSDIYDFNILSSRYSKITNSKNINFNGRYMGKDKIIFLSDRFRQINIFAKNLDLSDSATKVIFDTKKNTSMDLQNNNLVYLSKNKIKLKNLKSNKQEILYQSDNLISFIKVLSNYIMFYEKFINMKKIIFLNIKTKEIISIEIDEDIKALDF